MLNSYWKIGYSRIVALFPLILLALFIPKTIFAYSSNLSTSIVLGQSDFTTNSANQGGSPSPNTINGATHITSANGKLFVYDGLNNRILIWNTIPTANNAPADVVLGQPDFTSSSANNGGISARSLNLSWQGGIASDGTRLVVSDFSNNRILIWNTIPTSNDTPADVELGQPNFTSNSANNGGVSAHSLYSPMVVSIDPKGRLTVSDFNNARVLIWNSIPDTNEKNADLVIGQTSFNTRAQTNTPSQSTFRFPRAAFSDGDNLFVYDETNCRLLIWKGFPTQNGQNADIVLGSNDFSTSACSLPTSASGPLAAQDIYSDTHTLAIADSNRHRALIWNTIPSKNNQSADVVLGQADFTSGSVNRGGSVSDNSMSNPRGIWFDNSHLIIGDYSNNRVLIFDNVRKDPSLSVVNSPENIENGLMRFTGTASVPQLYFISNVSFSINGAGFSNATPLDGSFNSSLENYFFDFDPKSNQPRDEKGNLIDGYTLRIKTTNSNNDTLDNFMYFEPFTAQSPNAAINTRYPSFQFSTNKQIGRLRESLTKYEIQIKRGGGDWQTLIDNIPVNLDDGEYNKGAYTVTFSDDSSNIKVKSNLSPIDGNFVWRVAAVDKTGHEEYSNYKSVTDTAVENSVISQNPFNLAILNITGLGNTNISSFYPEGIRSEYVTLSSNPIFYGIAWSGSLVKLSLTDENCSAPSNCTKSYTSKSNSDSRFGINIPKGDLIFGKKYMANFSVSLGDFYNQLPEFVLAIGGYNTSYVPVTAQNITQIPTPAHIHPSQNPTPIPTQETSLSTHNNSSKKFCVWFLCF